MPRWLRWTGYGFATLAGLIAVAALLLYAVSSRHINRLYAIEGSPVRAANDSASLVRGRHLVESVTKCQECHGDDYGGKMVSDDGAFGRLPASNITRGRGGTGSFTDADWERALRHGVAPSGRPLIFMPAEAFTTLSDDDLAAIVGYLGTLPPVDREWPPPKVGPLARALYLKGDFPPFPSRSLTTRPSDDRPLGVLPWSTASTWRRSADAKAVTAQASTAPAHPVCPTSPVAVWPRGPRPISSVPYGRVSVPMAPPSIRPRCRGYARAT